MPFNSLLANDYHWSVRQRMFACCLIPIMPTSQSHDVLTAPLTTLCGHSSSQGSIDLSAIKHSSCNVKE